MAVRLLISSALRKVRHTHSPFTGLGPPNEWSQSFSISSLSSCYLSELPWIALEGMLGGAERMRGFGSPRTCSNLMQSTQAARLYSTGLAAGESLDGETVSEPNKGKEASEEKGRITTPRGFELTPVERDLADKVGYRVIARYTSDDFGRKKPPKAFAVVQIGSHQFKVSPGDLIYTEKLKFADINDKLMLSKVLLLGSKTQTVVGRPVVPKAAVFAVVEEHALDEKVIIFKKKRRKNYRRTTGHRQELTRLRILDIKGIEEPVRMEVVAKLSKPRKVMAPSVVEKEQGTPMVT